MSQENVEIVRGMFDAYLSGDAQRGIAAVHPEVEWDFSGYPLPDWPDTGEGRADYVRNLGYYLRGWQDYRSEVREVIDAGDDVFVALHETVALRESGAVLDRDIYQLCTVRGGLITRLRVFK